MGELSKQNLLVILSPCTLEIYTERLQCDVQVINKHVYMCLCVHTHTPQVHWLLLVFEVRCCKIKHYKIQIAPFMSNIWYTCSGNSTYQFLCIVLQQAFLSVLLELPMFAFVCVLHLQALEGQVSIMLFILHSFIRITSRGKSKTYSYLREGGNSLDKISQCAQDSLNNPGQVWIAWYPQAWVGYQELCGDWAPGQELELYRRS